jgi:hypothetical protein
MSKKVSYFKKICAVDYYYDPVFKCKNEEHYYVPIYCLKDTKAWICNRDIDPKKITQLLRYWDKNPFFLKHNTIGPIHFIEGSEKLECIDGNHRRIACLEYITKYIDSGTDIFSSKLAECENIICHIVIHKNTKTFHDVSNLFSLLNDNLPVSKIDLNLTKEDVVYKKEIKANAREISLKFEEKYPTIFSAKSTSTKSRRPLMNQYYFQNELCEYLPKQLLYDPKRVELEIIKINEKYKNIIKDNKELDFKTTKSMVQKCIKAGLYIFLNSDFMEELEEACDF